MIGGPRVGQSGKDTLKRVGCSQLKQRGENVLEEGTVNAGPLCLSRFGLFQGEKGGELGLVRELCDAQSAQRGTVGLGHQRGGTKQSYPTRIR